MPTICPRKWSKFSISQKIWSKIHILKIFLGNQPLGGNTDQSLQTILQLLQLQNMAKNQGSMLPNNSTPTTPKSETECDVTDDQENAHLEVEETETNVENSDEKSTGKFKIFFDFHQWDP